METGSRPDSAMCSGLFSNKLNEVKQQRDSYSENGSGCVIADVSDCDVLRCVRAVMGMVYSEVRARFVSLFSLLNKHV